MSLVISKVFTYDTDAGNYIQAVEAADGQALEPATRQAINNFVIGCKQDGIWNAIKASCILSGARTLNGALQPLVGTAPTNVGGLFVSGDYNRKTGLVGNGSSKYLNSNRLHTADPQNNTHVGIFVSTASTSGAGQYPNYFGAGSGSDGTVSHIEREQNNGQLFVRFKSIGSAPFAGGNGNAVNFIGTSRSASTQFIFRAGSVNSVAMIGSTVPTNINYSLFAGTQTTGSISAYSNARLAFYSIGESLDLALLDARVTALITAFGVAIP